MLWCLKPCAVNTLLMHGGWSCLTRKVLSHPGDSGGLASLLVCLQVVLSLVVDRKGGKGVRTFNLPAVLVSRAPDPE